MQQSKLASIRTLALSLAVASGLSIAVLPSLALAAEEYGPGPGAPTQEGWAQAYGASDYDRLFATAQEAQTNCGAPNDFVVASYTIRDGRLAIAGYICNRGTPNSNSGGR